MARTRTHGKGAAKGSSFTTAPSQNLPIGKDATRQRTQRTRQDMVALMKGEPLTTLKRNCIPAESEDESEDESDDKVESTAGRTPPASPTHELNLVASYANASQGEQKRLLLALHRCGALSTFIPDAAESLDAPSSPSYTPSSPSYDPCSPPWFP